MGGCASKPKVLKAEKAPPPLEAQSPAAENVEVQAQAQAQAQTKSAAEEVEAEAAPQVKNSHVDFSEPDADETKEADKEEVVPDESKPTETMDKAVEEVTEEKKEVV